MAPVKPPAGPADLPYEVNCALRILIAAAYLSPPLPAQQYSFRYYGHEHGIRNMVIQCLLQDRTGFIWAGTQNGLYRFDGDRFQEFGRAEGLPSSRVEWLHETADGTLWVGTRAGIARRVGDRFERAGAEAIQEILGQSGIVSDASNRLFVSTVRGLAIGSPSDVNGRYSFQLALHPAAWGDERAFGVHLDASGRVWYGCGQRICTWENGRASVVKTPGIPLDRWDAMQSDASGLWARSPRRLIYLANGSTRFVARERRLPPSGGNAQLWMDPDGTLFVPTDGGLARLGAGGM